MFGKWRIGSIAGINVYVHGTFVLLLLFVAGSRLFSGGAIAALSELAWVGLLFGIVVLHETGHALAARHYGIPTRDITLYPIGGVARLERMPRRPVEEMVVSIAGPAVNIVLAAAAWALRPFAIGEIDSWILARFLQINVALAIFNLLPAFPMDGGRVLRALLALRLPYLSATRAAARTGRVMAIVFAVAGVLIPAPMLVLVAVFVWMSGGAEERAVMMEHAYRQTPFFWFTDVPRGERWDPRRGPRDTSYRVLE